jgi:hypothetical protein
MKMCIAAFAGVLLAGMAWVQPVAAQGLPQGSYMRSCTGAEVRGDTLVATCRSTDGRERRTSLSDVRRCVGDIGNNNGNLHCNYGGGHAGPGPGYGERREGYGGDTRERCGGLHREAEELRIRMDREFNPAERMRTEGRLREVHEQEARAGCRR